MRGAPITIKCDCGQVQYVPYGEVWECPECERRWNTNQIPEEQYWGIMHEMKRHRIWLLGVSLVLGLLFALVVANVERQRAFPLALGMMAFWFLVYMPRWRRKVRRRARDLPRWQLHPE